MDFELIKQIVEYKPLWVFVLVMALTQAAKISTQEHELKWHRATIRLISIVIGAVSGALVFRSGDIVADAVGGMAVGALVSISYDVVMAAVNYGKRWLDGKNAN